MKTNLLLTVLLVLSLSLFAQDKIYVHTATPENIEGNTSKIDHPDLNGNPDAHFVLVHNWNGNNTDGVYNIHVTGVYYDGAHWRVFNEDLSNVEVGSKYNIYISDSSNYLVHEVTSENSSSNATVLDSSIGESDYVFATNYWDGIYNNHPYSTDFIAPNRFLYTPDPEPIPVGAKFMILFGNNGGTEYTHIATTENTENNYTIIDHPLLNGNPNATFIFQHYFGYNPETESNINPVLGVWYTPGNKWSIFTEDGSTMPTGLAFQILIAPQETLSTEKLDFADTKIYPNPTANKVAIQTNEAIVTVNVFNLLGKLIKTQFNTKEINLSTLPKGVYLLKIKTTKGTQIRKVIKK